MLSTNYQLRFNFLFCAVNCFIISDAFYFINVLSKTDLENFKIFYCISFIALSQKIIAIFQYTSISLEINAILKIQLFPIYCNKNSIYPMSGIYYIYTKAVIDYVLNFSTTARNEMSFLILSTITANTETNA